MLFADYNFHDFDTVYCFIGKACDNLGVKGVDLYGGTKHSTATALGEFLTPEQIKRDGTGSATNKAFERYFQPRRTESAKVVSTIKKMQKEKAGKVFTMCHKARSVNFS